MKEQELKAYRKAGQIAIEIKKYVKEIIKPGMLLVDIADKIEEKIEELGGKPAFPVNLSINDIAAHSCPTLDDKTKASGLLKVDIGVHINGFPVDTAITLDLENSEENKKLISTADKALQEAISIVKPEIEIWKIGEKIHNSITSKIISPVRNLSGHELSRNNVHAGVIIPNYNNNNNNKLKEGVYAIEPFSTLGEGVVYEGKPSGVYKLQETKPTRIGREVLKYIEENYSTLPFCSRWIEKKFKNSKIILKQFEQQGIIKQYSELVEKSHKKVAQSEHTILVTKDNIEVLT